MNCRGLILIQTLIFMLILAIISIVMAELTKTELQNNRAHQEQFDTYNNTHDALITAERWLATLEQRPKAQAQCLQPPCVYPLSAERNFNNASYWPQYAANIGNAQQPAYFLIELMASYADSKTLITTDYYQITAMSYATENHSMRIMQRVVSKPYDPEGTALALYVTEHSWRLLR